MHKDVSFLVISAENSRDMALKHKMNVLEIDF